MPVSCWGHSNQLATEIRWFANVDRNPLWADFIQMGLCDVCLGVFADGLPHLRRADGSRWQMKNGDFWPVTSGGNSQLPPTKKSSDAPQPPSKGATNQLTPSNEARVQKESDLPPSRGPARPRLSYKELGRVIETRNPRGGAGKKDAYT
jgi:hypothetical protein